MRSRMFGIVVFMALSVSAFGEKSTSPDQTEGKKAIAAQKPNSGAEKDGQSITKGKRNRTERFEPSERISADKPVSFPADI